MESTTLAAALLLSFGVASSAIGQVRVSEFLALNDRGLRDEDGERSDWIEVQNTSVATVSLAGWSLTDNPSQPGRWVFPEVSLAPGEFRLVFASDKNRRDPQGELHTNFKLSGDGEYLGLFKPDGSIATEFSPAFPRQFPDICYGLPTPGQGTTPVYFTTPTPGAANGAGSADIGPYLLEPETRARRPNRSPALGPVEETLVVTAPVVATGRPVTAVRGYYRRAFQPEATFPLRDDGVAPDVTAGDGFYTGEVPLAEVSPGQMIRWRFEAEDESGQIALSPRPRPNETSPRYHGTAAAPEGVASQLPVLEWFIQTPNAATTVAGTRAAVLYQGEFFDNVFVRRRGNSTASLAKKSYKFEFNPGHHVRLRADLPRVDEFDLNTTYTDKTYLRQPVAMETFELAGCPAPLTFPVRVQQNGVFHSVAWMTEQPDADFLRRAGHDGRGALYKMENTFTSATAGVEKKNRREETGNADLAEFIAKTNALDGAALDAWLFDNIDLPRVLGYLAASVVVQHTDASVKNYYLHRDSEGSGEWSIVPWDADLSFGRHFMTQDSILSDILWADKDYILGGASANVPIAPSHPFFHTQRYPANRNWNRLVNKLLQSDRIKGLFRRHLRWVMDRTLAAPAAAGDSWFVRRFEAWAATFPEDAALDRAKWGQFGGSQSPELAWQRLKTQYLDVRRIHLYETHLAANAANYHLANSESALLPGPEPVSPALTFGEVEARPPGGLSDEVFVEVRNPHDTAISLAGWWVDGPVLKEFPPGSLIEANGSLYLSPRVAAFRARATGPRGGQGLHVEGALRGAFPASISALTLRNPAGAAVATVIVPAAVDTGPSLSAWLTARGQSDPWAVPAGSTLAWVWQYLLGTDRRPASQGVAIQYAVDGTVEISLHRRPSPQGATLVVEWSEDLETWSISGPEPVVTAAPEGTEHVVFRLPAGASARYVRLRATVP